MRRIFIETIPIDIPIAEVMMTSYSEEGTIPKTSKIKFFKLSISSAPTIVPRPLQVDKAALPQVPIKGRSVLSPKSHNQSDLILEGIEPQVYSGSITRSMAKALIYAEVSLQSSATTLSQGRDQREE